MPLLFIYSYSAKSYLIDEESLRSVFKDAHSFAVILAMGLVLYMVTIIKQQDYDVFNLLLLNIGMIELYLSNSSYFHICYFMSNTSITVISHKRELNTHNWCYDTNDNCYNKSTIYLSSFIKLILKGRIAKKSLCRVI